MVSSKNGKYLDELETYLRSVYPEISVRTGNRLNYIGMSFDFSTSGKVSVTMDNCVAEILRNCGEVSSAKTPATEDLFDVRDTPKLGVEESKYFHTQVAKLLYLAKRVRPECLTAVAFLSTRVQN